MVLNTFAKSLLTLLMLLLLPLAALTISGRVVVHYVKNDPIIIRKAISDFTGIDIRYKKVDLNTQLNHWKLKVEEIKILQKDFVFKADSIFLDLSLFPEFFKTGLSSFHAENATLIINDTSNTPKNAHAQLEFLSALSLWKSIVFTKLDISNVKKDYAIKLSNLTYLKKDIALLQGELSFSLQKENPYSGKGRIQAGIDTHKNWQFDIDIFTVLNNGRAIAEDFNVTSTWDTENDQWFIQTIGTINQFRKQNDKQFAAKGRYKNSVLFVDNMQLGKLQAKNIKVKKDDSQLNFVAQNLPLSDLHSVVATFSTEVSSMEIDGLIKSVDMTFNLANNDVQALQLDVNDFALKMNHPDFQSISSVDLTVNYKNDSGEFEIHSDRIEFLAQALYSKSRVVQDFSGSGTLTGDFKPLPDITLTDATFKTINGYKARMNLQISQLLDKIETYLKIDIPTASKDESRHWIPDNNINSNAHSWIKDNFIEGDLKHFFLELKGTPEAIARVAHKDHHLKIGFAVDEIVVTPLPGWKRIKLHNANFLFFKNVLDISALSGTLEGVRLGKTLLTLDTNKTGSKLLIKSNARGEAPVVNRYLKKSKLPKILGIVDLVENTELETGTISADLELRIRISDKDDTPTKVEGFVQFKDLSFNMYGQAFSDGKGRIIFNDGNIRFSKLEALWYGHPIMANLVSSPVYAGEYRVELFGKIEPNNWISHVAGTSNFEGFFDIPRDHNEYPVLFQFTSTFEGVTSFLPLPFNKAEKDVMMFKLSASQTNKTLTVDVKIGEGLSGATLIREVGQVQFNKGGIWIGRQSKLSLLEKSFIVDIDLPVISMNRWFDFIKKFTEYRESYGEQSGFEFPKINQVKLKTNMLRFNDSSYADIAIFAQLRKNLWTATVDSSVVKGVINYQIDKKALNADLERFHLARAQSSAEKKCLSHDKKNWNKLQVRVKDFKFGNQNLGRLTFDAVQEEKKLVVPTFSLHHSAFELTGSAEHDISSSNRLSFNYIGEDLSHMLRILELNENEVKADEVKSSGTVSWQGSLFCPEFDNLYGTVVSSGKNGVIRSAEPGFGRLVSLLSVRTLAQRFSSFKWSDVTQPGMAFEEGELDVTFNDGTIVFNRLDLKSTAADLDIRGTSDARSRTHDLRALASPKYTDALVPLYILFGGVSAGVGLGAVAANEVFNLSGGNEVLIEVYRIRGSWDKPNIERE